MTKQILLDCGEIRPQKQSIFTALRRETNLKCLILTLLILASVICTILWCGRSCRLTTVNFEAFPIATTRTVSPCSDGYVYIPTAFIFMLYLLYLVECWCSKAREMLSLPKTDVNTVYRKVHQMRLAKPMIWWKAICYHYVKRRKHYTRMGRNQGAFTESEVCYERINSHVASSSFFYGLCGMNDISRDLVDLEKFAVTKVRFQKGFIFSNSLAAQEFEDQRAIFFQEQEGCDDYLEMKEGLELANVTFQENMTAWTSPDKLPWFGRPRIFWLSSFFLLSWPLRIMLELNTAHVRYQVTKIFGTNYASPQYVFKDGSSELRPQIVSPRGEIQPHQWWRRALWLKHIMSHHSRSRKSPSASTTTENTYLLLSSEPNSPTHAHNTSRSESGEHAEGSPHRTDDVPNSRGAHESRVSNAGTVKSLESEDSSKNSKLWNDSTPSYHFPYQNHHQQAHHHYNFPWFTPPRNEEDGWMTSYRIPRSVTLLLSEPGNIHTFESQSHQTPSLQVHYGSNDNKKNHQDVSESERHNNNHFNPQQTSLPSANVADLDTNWRSVARQSENPDADHIAEEEASWNLIPTYSEALLLLGESKSRVGGGGFGRNSGVSKEEGWDGSGESSHSSSVRDEQGESVDRIFGAPAFPTLPPPPPCFTRNNYALSSSNTPFIPKHSRTTSSPSPPLPAPTYQPNPHHQSIVHPDAFTSSTKRPFNERKQRESNALDQQETPHSSTSSTIMKHMGPHPTFVASNYSNQEKNIRAFSRQTTPSNHTPSQKDPSPLSAKDKRPPRSVSIHNLSGLHRSESFRVLCNSIPRSVTGIPVDLTRPVSASVPFDPYKETRTMWDLNSTSLESSPTSTALPPPTTRKLGQNILLPMHSESPPDYIEALKTSRPASLPRWAKLRRCLTERNLWDNGTKNYSKLWLHQIKPTFLQKNPNDLK